MPYVTGQQQNYSELYAFNVFYMIDDEFQLKRKEIRPLFFVFSPFTHN